MVKLNIEHANYKLEYLENCKNNDVIKNQKRFIQLSAWHTCLNCNYWKDEKCCLYQSVPPVEVIVNSCEKWSDATILF